MPKIYYVVEANDGAPQSRELATLKEARKELKELLAEDKKNGIDGLFDYYIAKYTETDDTIYCEEYK